MAVYYNEFDPHAAAWLRELIKAGHIADGVVDERSIEDVTPDELVGFAQCHFFAGIGGWSLALRKAGVQDDYPVWTASCPCQPFSAAGKGGGFDDDRHLWPSFYWLAAQCRPAIIFGEQVASKATGNWFDLVQADMEALDYAFGLVPFPAASIGAPHIRDRAYWVGHSERQGLEGFAGYVNGAGGRTQPAGSTAEAGAVGGLADFTKRGLPELRGAMESRDVRHADSGRNSSCGLADINSTRSRERKRNDSPARYRDSVTATSGADRHEPASPTNGEWRDADWLICRDGKWRPVERGTFPLVNGLPKGVGYSGDPRAPGYAEKTAEARVMRLKGYGNAIVPAQAAIFIETVFDAAQE